MRVSKKSNIAIGIHVVLPNTQYRYIELMPDLLGEMRLKWDKGPFLLLFSLFNRAIGPIIFYCYGMNYFVLFTVRWPPIG